MFIIWSIEVIALYSLYKVLHYIKSLKHVPSGKRSQKTVERSTMLFVGKLTVNRSCSLAGKYHQVTETPNVPFYTIIYMKLWSFLFVWSTLQLCEFGNSKYKHDHSSHFCIALDPHQMKSSYRMEGAIKGANLGYPYSHIFPHIPYSMGSPSELHPNHLIVIFFFYSLLICQLNRNLSASIPTMISSS